MLTDIYKMQAWNQWGNSPNFQGAVFPGTDITSAAPIPPPTAPSSGYPMGGYPYYGPGGMQPVCIKRSSYLITI